MLSVFESSGRTSSFGVFCDILHSKVAVTITDGEKVWHTDDIASTTRFHVSLAAGTTRTEYGPSYAEKLYESLSKRGSPDSLYTVLFEDSSSSSLMVTIKESIGEHATTRLFQGDILLHNESSRLGLMMMMHKISAKFYVQLQEIATLSAHLNESLKQLQQATQRDEQLASMKEKFQDDMLLKMSLLLNAKKRYASNLTEGHCGRNEVGETGGNKQVPSTVVVGRDGTNNASIYHDGSDDDGKLVDDDDGDLSDLSTSEKRRKVGTGRGAQQSARRSVATAAVRGARGVAISSQSSASRKRKAIATASSTEIPVSSPSPGTGTGTGSRGVGTVRTALSPKSDHSVAITMPFIGGGEEEEDKRNQQQEREVNLVLSSVPQAHIAVGSVQHDPVVIATGTVDALAISASTNPHSSSSSSSSFCPAGGATTHTTATTTTGTIIATVDTAAVAPTTTRSDAGSSNRNSNSNSSGGGYPPKDAVTGGSITTSSTNVHAVSMNIGNSSNDKNSSDNNNHNSFGTTASSSSSTRSSCNNNNNVGPPQHVRQFRKFLDEADSDED
mmetsp:Transcript_7066/g.11886  ORF Transcript_7066/g.11886 Transcript_7066/m.11886 type:complete len:557 (+) Transcript_7066:63-1733(+)